MTASRVRLAIELDGVSEKPTSCRRRQILAPTVLNRPFRRFIQGDRPKGRSQLAMTTARLMLTPIHLHDDPEDDGDRRHRSGCFNYPKSSSASGCGSGASVCARPSP